MAFDLQRFLNAEYTDSFATERVRIPEGDWKAHTGQLDVQATDRPNVLQGRLTIDFDDEDLSNHPDMEGRDKISTTVFLFIDIDETSGLMKFKGGQNFVIGQIRQALGQNNPGKAWNPSMMENRGPIYCKVEHRTVKGKEGKEDRIVDNIVKYSPAS